MISEYWDKKIKDVAKIAEEYGYPLFDIEFWERQESGVLSLIIDIYDKEKKS